MANLTVRNLTPNDLELIVVELVESKNDHTGFGKIASSTCGLITRRKKDHNPTSDDVKYNKQDTSFCIKPFTHTQTDIHIDGPSSKAMRLVFRSECHTYQVAIPSHNGKSSTMEKLDGGDQELTAVYVPAGAYITVFSSANLNCWMHSLHDDYPLPALSIPGTHNSATCYRALPSVRCQAVSVTQQLQHGVRFLDVRCSADPVHETLTLVHGAFPITLVGNKYFGTLCDEIYDFLEKNPSETVIMSLKREGTGKGTDEHMSKHLKNHYIDKKPERWWTDPRIPTLGQARGRIVALRRLFLDEELTKCHDGRGWAIDAQTWPDNCEDGTVEGGHIRVQDFYEIVESKNVSKKIDYSRGQLERAAEQLHHYQMMEENHCTPPLFVNFLTANNFFSASCWPERVAAKVNPAIVEYLCLHHGEEGRGPKKLRVGSAGTGVVVTDWVGLGGDWDLIRCIVGMNARLQLKSRC